MSGGDGLQIEYLTQFGFLLILVGGVCAAKPYLIAKWHENDVASQSRLHKRAEGHKKKKDRVEFDSSGYDGSKEPGHASVIAVRVLGAIAVVFGLFLVIKSSVM